MNHPEIKLNHWNIQKSECHGKKSSWMHFHLLMDFMWRLSCRNKSQTFCYLINKEKSSNQQWMYFILFKCKLKLMLRLKSTIITDWIDTLLPPLPTCSHVTFKIQIIINNYFWCPLNVASNWKIIMILCSMKIPYFIFMNCVYIIVLAIVN